VARKRKSRAWANLVGVLPEAPEKGGNEYMERVFAAKDALVVCETCGLREGGHTQQVGTIPPGVEGWHLWSPRPMNMAELADEQERLELIDAEAAQAASERGVIYNALERRMLEELAKIQEASGQDMWRRPGMTLSPKFSPQAMVKDRAALLAWVKETGQEALLSLGPQALKGIITNAYNQELAALMTPAQRSKLTAGLPASMLPPPGVEVYLRPGVNRSGGKRAQTPDEDDE